MTHLWTPNQTPTPCRCVKYNPAPGSVKCGTCGGLLPLLPLTYTRTHADAARNQGGPERGLIG